MKTKEEIRAEVIASLQRIKDNDLVEKGYLFGLLFALGYGVMEADAFIAVNRGKTKVEWKDDTNETDSVESVGADFVAWEDDDA